ncbi:TPA: GrlR family regulatory protein [Salmonella enterica]|nr:nucleoside transporter [Salmonella enterica subsp. enterica serovar Mountpleasant]
MRNGIYRVCFESNQSSFGEGIVVVCDGKAYGGDIGFTFRGELNNPELELSISRYNDEIPSVLGVEGDYQLILRYEDTGDEEYCFTGYVKGNEERKIIGHAVFLITLL